MAAALKFICFLGLLVLLSVGGIGRVDAAEECEESSPDSEAFKLMPCAQAAKDEKAAVSENCCDQVRSLSQSPRCLCAVMLSNTAKAVGIKPAIAITIPKSCNVANRRVGYKCGAYTLEGKIYGLTLL